MTTTGRFEDMPDDAFRASARDWLQTHYPPEFRQDARRPFRRLRGEDHLRWVRLQQAHGWRAPAWPAQYGGLGLQFRHRLIYQQELERIGAARVIDNGETHLGPTLLLHGSEEQRQQWMPGILAGETVWAQGYSEPGAGSDLASLRTRAVREGEAFVVDGQKIWTTHAEDCTHMFALVRTHYYQKRQQGISFLLIDLRAPGVTIRPIRNIAGESELCEVFFDGVRVPLSNVVGGVDKGWDVAKALLGHERIWLGSPAMAASALALARDLVRAAGLEQDGGVMDRLAQLCADLHDYRLVYDEICNQLMLSDEAPGADVSLLKIYVSELLQRITEFNVEVAGEHGGVTGDVEIGGLLTDLHWQLMMARPVTIYAGANEVQRDIIAKATLKLPEAQQRG